MKLSILFDQLRDNSKHENEGAVSQKGGIKAIPPPQGTHGKISEFTKVLDCSSANENWE